MGAIDTGLNTTAESAGFANTQLSLPLLVDGIITALLTMIGVYLMVLFFYGGYEWMSSGGDTKQVQSAKDRIRNATIGLAIILSSYALSRFIFDQLAQATQASS